MTANVQSLRPVLQAQRLTPADKQNEPRQPLAPLAPQVTHSFAPQRRAGRRMTRAERRRTLRTLREIALALSCIAAAVGLPGWVESIL